MVVNRSQSMSQLNKFKGRGYENIVPVFRFGMSLVFSALMGCLFVSGKPITSTRPANITPIQYFETNCARCHGSYGRAFGDDFGKDLSDKQLRQTVSDMAAGPAKAPLDGEPLDVLVAFHRALIKKEPFLVWTGASKSALWGEVSPGSKVQARFGKSTVDAQVKGVEWQVKIPPKASGKAIITARIGEKQTTLDLSKNSYSHAK